MFKIQIPAYLRVNSSTQDTITKSNIFIFLLSTFMIIHLNIIITSLIISHCRFYYSLYSPIHSQINPILSSKVERCFNPSLCYVEVIVSVVFTNQQSNNPVLMLQEAMLKTLVVHILLCSKKLLKILLCVDG